MRSPGRASPSRVLLAAGVLCAAAGLLRADGRPPVAPRRLLIAYSSFRDRPLHPRLYFYEHDGVGSGAQAGAIEAAPLRVETRAALAEGGQLVACASEVENQPGDILLWHRGQRRVLESPPGLNSESPEIGAAISADGKVLACAAWQRSGLPAHWSIFLYDLTERRPLEAPFNTDDDETQPSLSHDGRYLAFVSNRPGGQGQSDIYLYDRQARALAPLPGLNSASRESEPALSADGNYLAFTSDRPGGSGSLDIYLYERSTRRLLPLPGLNAIGPDQSPALTADARYLAFAAERVSGAGERDIYLYDRDPGRLLPLPGLNGATEDFDPAICYLP